MPRRVTEEEDAADLPTLAQRLVVLAGPDAGRALELSEGEHRIGADTDCALVLSDPLVSRGHLAVEVSGLRVKVIDLGSTNGSFLNGMRFSTLEVLPGAVVRVGRTELQFLPAGAARKQYSEGESFGGLFGRSL